MQSDINISIIIPCFNEKETINKVFEKVKNSQINNKEIIIVDDCSNDGSKEIIEQIKKNNSNINLKTLFHHINEGKGSAIKTGLKEATNDFRTSNSYTIT